MAYFCHKEGPCRNSKFSNEHSEFQNVGMRVTEQPFDGGCKAMRLEKLTYWVAILWLMAGLGLTGTDAMAQSALPGPSIQLSAPAETKLAAMPANPVSVVSIPLIIDRHASAGQAMRASVHAVLRNIPAMVLWSASILVLTVIGYAPFLGGLLIVAPLLGHATWHAYKDMIH